MLACYLRGHMLLNLFEAAAHPAWQTHGRAWRGRVADVLALLARLVNEYGELRAGLE
jgi:hypothetical protein